MQTTPVQTSSVEAEASADNVDLRFSTAHGQPYRKGVPLSLSLTGDTNSGAFIPGTASSEALPWGSNLVSGASPRAIKGAAEFADSGITVQGTDPSSSRLDRSDGGVQPVFEGVAVNNVSASSSNQGTAPTRSSLDRSVYALLSFTQCATFFFFFFPIVTLIYCLLWITF